jgi:MFS family permease
MEPSRRRSETFFGWWIVLALFWILVHVTGMGFYVFPVFIGSLQAEFGWSMTEISTGVAIFTIAFGCSGPVVGVLIGRFGIRATMLGMAFAIGPVVGIPLAGNVFDRTGSYESVLLACVAGCLIASALALLVRPERHRDEFVAEAVSCAVPGG